MDADFSGNANRIVVGGGRGARDQNFNRSRSASGKIRAGLERFGVELQISCLSLRTCRSIDRILCRAYPCELADRRSMFGDPNFDRFLAHLRQRALFVGCGLCGRARNFVRADRLEIGQEEIVACRLRGNNRARLLNAAVVAQFSRL